MTRRDWHTLAAYATIAALLLAVVVFVVMLWTVLRHSASADGAPIQPRPTPTVASRDLTRLPWPSSKAYPAQGVIPADIPNGVPLSTPVGALSRPAAATDSTSPRAAGATASNSVAAVPPASSTSVGEAGQEGSSVWDKLAFCESRNEWQINTGNGYYGGLQENLDFWRTYSDGHLNKHGKWVLDYTRPDLAPQTAQEQAAERARDGFTDHNGTHWDARGYVPWPQCSVKEGLR